MAIHILVSTTSECAARSTAPTRTTPSAPSTSATAGVATLSVSSVFGLSVRRARLLVFLACDGAPLFGVAYERCVKRDFSGGTRVERTFIDPRSC